MIGTRCTLAVAIGVLPAWGCGQILTEAALFLNPEDVTPNFYARYQLADLNQVRTVVWNRQNDPVIEAKILPFLTRHDFPKGHVFTSDDYFYRTIHGDYNAGIFGGELVATFNTKGIYIVRLFRRSGATQTEAVFAEAGYAEKNGHPDRTGPMGKEPAIPGGDLFLIDAPDEETRRLANVFVAAGRAHTEVETRAQAIDKIKTYSRFVGRKLHVEFVGHGAVANASMGAGKENIADKQLDRTSLESFTKALKPYVRKITFQSCSVGEGEEGLQFLYSLASAFGEAGAYNGTICSPDGRTIMLKTASKFVVVPEPAGAVAFGLGLMVLGSRRHHRTHK